MLGLLCLSLAHFYLPLGNLVKTPAFLYRSRRGWAVCLEPGFSQHGGLHLDMCSSEVAERSPARRVGGMGGLKPSRVATGRVLLEPSIFPRFLTAPNKLKCPGHL